MTLPSEIPDETGFVGSRAAIDTLVGLIEAAFDGDPYHSILGNLRNLGEPEWTVAAPGGDRSVADILEHVAWVKWMYEDYTFGPASMRGDQPPLVPADGARWRPRQELLAWLTDGHRRWAAAVRALRDDAELERPRLTHWGEPLSLRAIIHIAIAHDLYHAGEINHLRAVLQGTDHGPRR
jgi:uncharacterized damage-inducible protein DinB